MIPPSCITQWPNPRASSRCRPVLRFPTSSNVLRRVRFIVSVIDHSVLPRREVTAASAQLFMSIASSEIRAEMTSPLIIRHCRSAGLQSKSKSPRDSPVIRDSAAVARESRLRSVAAISIQIAQAALTPPPFASGSDSDSSLKNSSRMCAQLRGETN
jgi:hypothetical protein